MRTLLAAATAAILLASCTRTVAPTQGAADSAPATISRTRPATPASPRPVTPAADPAVALARVFIGMICPYNWQSAISYGQNWNTALTRYADTALAARRRWSTAKVAAVQAELRAHHARQDCGSITGGHAEDDTTGSADTRQLRFSVTVTVSAADAAPSSAQQTYRLTARLQHGQWLIADGQW